MRFGEKILSLLSLCVIEIYSSSHCTECQRAWSELSSMGVEVRAVSFGGWAGKEDLLWLAEGFD
jgi:hypothetical protein